MRRTILAALGAVGLTAPAAGHPPCPAPGSYVLPVTRYETRVVSETRRVPYTKVVTRYDPCGAPYTVRRTGYAAVEVPVRKTVAVTTWVEVCDP